jgi:hypothetical protein
VTNTVHAIETTALSAHLLTLQKSYDLALFTILLICLIRILNLFHNKIRSIHFTLSWKKSQELSRKFTKFSTLLNNLVQKLFLKHSVTH